MGAYSVPAITRVINVLDCGAKMDGVVVKDATWSSSSATVSSTSQLVFNNSHVGMCIALKDSVTSTTYRRVGTVLSVANGVATVSGGNMPNSVSGTGIFYLGTDDTSAIQKAYDLANPEDQGGAGFTWNYRYGGTIVFPAGWGMVTKEITIRPCVVGVGQGRNATHLKWMSTNTMAAPGYYAMFTGVDSSGSSRIYYDIGLKNMHIDMSAAFTTTYSYHAKCVEAINLVRPVFSGLFLDSSPATSIGVDFVAGGQFTDNYFLNAGRLWVPGGGGGSGLDFQTGSGVFTAENALVGTPLDNIISRNTFIDCMVSAVRCTDNGTSLTPSRTIISNNMIKSKLTTGKGIEDNGNTGAVIIGNSVAHYTNAQTSEGPIGSEGQHIWCGIMSTGGKDGVIANNTITGAWYDGIRLNRFQLSGSTITPQNYRVEGNVIDGATRNGIRADINSTYLMKNVGISGNTVTGCGSAGVALSNSGTGGTISYVDISADNQIYDNAQLTTVDVEKSGILIDTNTDHLNVAGGNHIYDSGTGKQKYAITVNNAAVTAAFVNGNDLSGNTASAINIAGTGSLAGEVTNNKGYNPLGAVTVALGASPATYTAGNTPETIFVNGTITSVTKNGVAIPVGNTFSMPLNPNEQVTIAYPGAAPTVVSDRK